MAILVIYISIKALSSALARGLLKCTESFLGSCIFEKFATLTDVLCEARRGDALREIAVSEAGLPLSAFRSRATPTNVAGRLKLRIQRGPPTK